MSRCPQRAAVLLAWSVATLSPAVTLAQYGTTNGEWRSYGGDLGSTKYAPLDQIDATNFDALRLAWRWRSPDESLDLEALRQDDPRLGFRMFRPRP